MPSALSAVGIVPGGNCVVDLELHAVLFMCNPGRSSTHSEDRAGVLHLLDEKKAESPVAVLAAGAFIFAALSQAAGRGKLSLGFLVDYSGLADFNGTAKPPA